MFEEKIIDFVLGKAKVEEKIVSVEELYSFDEDAKPAKKKKAAVPTLDDVPKPPEKPKRTGGTKNLQKLLNTLEREISQLETQSSDLEQQMVDAASDSGKLLELMTEKEACDEKLAAKMDEWEAVAAELEELQ